MGTAFRIVVMTLLSEFSGVGGVAYFRSLVFLLGDEMTSLNLVTDQVEVSVEVSYDGDLLEAATINDRFTPHESITRVIEVVLLYYSETYLFLTAVTLDIDEKSSRIRTPGTAAATVTEKLFQEIHVPILQGDSAPVKMLAQ
ncbi:MAG TPA: hypothetical protein VFI27_21630 [candidate division Zixibacteria bacterium]|nr:hypothetical protein [candidate division Zixibacteria bacterium]